MALQLGVVSDGAQLGYVRVRRLPFRIGRGTNCDLSLNNSSNLSRLHAKLMRKQGLVVLVLMGKNPSYLNDEPLVPGQATELRDGDVIDFPDCRLHVRDLPETDVAHISTVNVQMPSRGTILVRKIAAALGVSQWRVEAIHHWLQQGRGRLVQVRYEQLHLTLQGSMSADAIQTNLDQLARLLLPVDVKDITVIVIDPARAPVHALPPLIAER